MLPTNKKIRHSTRFHPTFQFFLDKSKFWVIIKELKKNLNYQKGTPLSNLKIKRRWNYFIAKK